MTKTLSRDTSPEAEAVQLAILRGMPAWRKWQLIEESCRLTATLVEAGIRARHPGASDEEIEHRVRVVVLGEELAEAVRARLRRAP